MFDLHSARDSQPAAELPKHRAYEGGEDRAAWHVAEAMRVFTEHFGQRPRGCWPAEGAVSTATLELLDRFASNGGDQRQRAARESRRGGGMIRVPMSAAGASGRNRCAIFSATTTCPMRSASSMPAGTVIMRRSISPVKSCAGGSASRPGPGGFRQSRRADRTRWRECLGALPFQRLLLPARHVCGARRRSPARARDVVRSLRTGA